MAHALSAAARVYLVDLLALGDRIVGALGLADITVDALVSDQQSHRRKTWLCEIPGQASLAFNAALTLGSKNWDTSPPREAISLTREADKKV